jgi:hypothetical protein
MTLHQLLPRENLREDAHTSIESGGEYSSIDEFEAAEPRMHE